MPTSSKAIFDGKFVIFIYGGLLIFMIYQKIQSIRARKKIQGENHSYKPDNKMMNFVIIIIFILMGVYNIFTKMYIAGVLMILLAIAFLVNINDSVVVAKNGLYGSGRFYTWEEIRKWAWDKEKGDLVLLIKPQGKQEESVLLFVGVENMLQVNEKIREYKLKKGSIEE